MVHEVLERIEEIGPALEAAAGVADELCSLPAGTAGLLRSSGVVRMLQPKAYGGTESEPWDFFDAVIAIARRCGAAGWVSGVVGVHPWQVAMLPESVQREVWGDDPDTWIASPFSPFGRARRVDGGYLLSGRWKFSSGTDHCDWAWLGAVVTGDDGPTGTVHMLLPRADYTIVPDSWNAVGLRGSGSKDVEVRHAFVPAERMIVEETLMDGRAAREAGRTEPLYLLPWAAMFPHAITAAIVGTCLGAIDTTFAYHRDRVDESGRKVREDTFLLGVLSEACSEVESVRAQMMANVRRMWDLVDSGREVPFELRAQTRRDQVRGSRRAVEALDRVYSHSGGNALRLDRPMQRLWRDAHAGLNHAINSYARPYQAYALTRMGVELPAGDCPDI